MDDEGGDEDATVVVVVDEGLVVGWLFSGGPVTQTWPLEYLVKSRSNASASGE